MKEVRQQPVTIQTTTVGNIQIPLITEEIRRRLDGAAGRIPYPLTNDRAFRGLVSYSVHVQVSLAAILLAVPEDQIVNVTMLNPISFGQPFNRKETQEDIRLLVNDNIILDIELQNVDLRTNTKRFLLYLCRNYDSLQSGADYSDLKSNMFIGIMNYNFEQEEPAFFSQYRIMNKRTGRPLFQEDNYFGVNVINLKQTNLADDSDIDSGRLLLADLFRAQTWEELKTLASRSSFAKEVASIMYASNADIREQIALDGARRYDELMATIQKEQEEDRRQLEEQARLLEEKKQQLDERMKQLNEKRQQLDETNQQLDEKTQQLNETNQQLDEKTQQLDEKTQQLDEKTQQLDEKTQQLDEARQKAEEERLRADALQRELDALRKKVNG